MTTEEIVKYMNSTRVKVKVEDLMFLRKYYLSMYRVYMVKLFDECFISDPTVFDTKELYHNISDMGITAMFTVAGEINLSYEQAKYALYKSDKSVKDFLFNLMNALKYREYGLLLDRMYEDFEFRGSDEKKIKIDVCIRHTKICARGTNFGYAMAECITPLDREVRTLSLNEYIWSLAMAELGIPKEDWQSDGLIDGKLTHFQEVECIEGMLNGKYSFSCGKYSLALMQWLRDHPWGKNRMSLDKQGLYDYIFSKYEVEINNALDILSSVIEKDEGSRLIGVCDSTMYYSVPRTSVQVPYGVFQVLNGDDCEEVVTDEEYNIGGVTGEFYSISRLEEDGISYAGCPIMLDTPTGSEIVYDREQTDVAFDSWFSYNDVNFSFDSGAVGKRSVFGVGSVSDELYRGYINSLRSAENLITTIYTDSVSQIDFSRFEVRKFLEGVQK